MGKNEKIKLKRDYNSIENEIKRLQGVLDEKKYALLVRKKADLMQDLGCKTRTLYEVDYKGERYLAKIKAPKIINYDDKEARVVVKFFGDNRPVDTLGHCYFAQARIIQELESEQEALDLKAFSELENQITCLSSQ